MSTTKKPAQILKSTLLAHPRKDDNRELRGHQAIELHKHGIILLRMRHLTLRQRHLTALQQKITTISKCVLV